MAVNCGWKTTRPAFAPHSSCRGSAHKRKACPSAEIRRPDRKAKTSHFHPEWLNPSRDDQKPGSIVQQSGFYAAVSAADPSQRGLPKRLFSRHPFCFCQSRCSGYRMLTQARKPLRCNKSFCASEVAAIDCGRCRIIRPICGIWSGRMRHGFLRILVADPDRHFRDSAADGRAILSSTDDEGEAMRALRRMKSGSRTSDRLHRYRRRLAGDAGDARAHRTGRLCRAGCACASSSTMPYAANARAADPSQRKVVRLYRAGHGQDGCVRTELFKRHRSDCFLRS